jgi:uncharacterized protein
MPVMPKRPGPAARALLVAVRAYQLLLSPLFAGSCRYVPSCSQYMAEAVRRHGAARGGWLGVRRLARCHPFGSSGFDPVPEARSPICASHEAQDSAGSGFPRTVLGTGSRCDYSHGKVR